MENQNPSTFFRARGISLIAIILIIVGVLAVAGGVYLGFVYKKCEQISPPKIGQQDPRIIEKGGKLYFCQSYFDKLLNLTPPSMSSFDIDETANVVEEIKQASFSYPFPLSWQEDGISYSLAGVSLGRIVAPPGLIKTSVENFNPGEEIYALTLVFKIKSSQDASVPMNFRMELNEEGDMAVPNTRQFMFPGTGGQLAIQNITYTDQRVIFVVPESQKVFNITTGGKSNIFFTVTVLENGQLKVEK